MMKKGTRESIKTISCNTSLSIDERIEAILKLRENLDEDNEDERLQTDIEYYYCLIEMINEENGPHIYDLELLQLHTLIAENYVRLKDYRQLKKVANDVLNVIRYEVTSWKAMEETLPRIIDAVGESVYNHALYELLLTYLRAAFKEGKLDGSLKGRIRKMLKLRILLDDGKWLDRLLEPEFQSAIANLFSSDELLKIILRPQIGHLAVDSVEYTWEWENIYYDVEDRLNDRFANYPRQLGFCHEYWYAKRELLENEYNITWHSPCQTNPGVMFD